MNALAAINRHTYYDAKRDAFVVEMVSGEGEKELEEYFGVEVEDVRLYPVGAFNWIWEETEEMHETS